MRCLKTLGERSRLRRYSLHSFLSASVRVPLLCLSIILIIKGSRELLTQRVASCLTSTLYFPATGPWFFGTKNLPNSPVPVLLIYTITGGASASFTGVNITMPFTNGDPSNFIIPEKATCCLLVRNPPTDSQLCKRFVHCPNIGSPRAKPVPCIPFLKKCASTGTPARYKRLNISCIPPILLLSSAVPYINVGGKPATAVESILPGIRIEP